MSKLNYKNLSITLLLLTTFNYIFFTQRFFERENGYILGDWIINYEGGFIRRGFLGELILYITKIFSFDLIIFSFIFVTFLYLIFIILLIKLINKSRINLILAIIIFSPSTILFNFFDPLAIGRKEFIFFLFLLIYLLCDRSKVYIYFLSLLSIIITLTHELFTFLIPFFFISRLIECEDFNIKNYFLEFFIAFFSIIPFLFIIFFPNPDTKIICDYVKEFGLSSNVCWAINDSNNIVPTKLFKSASYINDNYYFYYYLFSLALILVPIFLCLKFNFKYNLYKIIILIILTLLPVTMLFLFVNDWGRYLNVYSVFWMLILINFNKKNDLQKINLMKLLVIIIFASSWYMPHCCPERHFGNLKYKPGIYYLFERINYRLNN